MAVNIDDEAQTFEFLEYYLQMIGQENNNDDLIALYNHHKAAVGHSFAQGGVDLLQDLIDAWQDDIDEGEDIGPNFSVAAQAFFERENPDAESPFNDQNDRDLEKSWAIEAAYRDLIIQLGLEPV